MEYLYSQDPIIACSTGNSSNSAIAVIRLSGFDNFKDIENFFSLKNENLKPRYAHFCKLVFNKKVIDEVVITYFNKPHSYNGENILEISVHGNVLNVEKIINLFIKNSNFRRAFPGEFSYRALRNQKLTLPQVEGLDLLLNANSNFSLEQGYSLLNGQLQNDYQDLYKKFLRHKSSVELSIDFFEDIGEEAANQQFLESLKDLKLSVDKIVSHSNNTGVNLLNPEITLVGLPNAGKSSLFNKMLKDSRAIVSNIAGTTRDFITENILIGDVSYRLTDTAGIRTTKDIIESAGIERALKLLTTSFYKILLINPYEVVEEYFLNFKDINFDLIIFTHNDKDEFEFKKEELINSLSSKGLNFGPTEPKVSGPIGAKNNGPIEPERIGPIGANLLNGDDKFLDVVFDNINAKYLSFIKNQPILLTRHQDVINKLSLLVKDYSSLAENEGDISIISSELNGIGHCISELIGIVSPDDVLHNIFNNFCIGK